LAKGRRGNNDQKYPGGISRVEFCGKLNRKPSPPRNILQINGAGRDVKQQTQREEKKDKQASITGRGEEQNTAETAQRKGNTNGKDTWRH